MEVHTQVADPHTWLADPRTRVSKPRTKDRVMRAESHFRTFLVRWKEEKKKKMV